MNIHGERYASVGLFIGFCRDLNVKTTERELERYEEIGAMFPSARVVYPDEYIIQEQRQRQAGNWDWENPDEWPALSRLTEKVRLFPYGYGDMTDEERLHCFDREMDRRDNPYLFRPDGSGFRAWSEYRVTVPDQHGNEIKWPTAEHYYSYWQVHQLHFIQQYPDLFKNTCLIDNLRDDWRRKAFFPRSPSKERLAGFEGMKCYFDALSFWITLYTRERNRTFAGITEEDGRRRLDDAQAEDYRKRLSELSRQVVRRFKLDREDLYKFLRKLIGLYQGYERDEWQRLAAALERDFLSLEDLIESFTGDTREQVENELGRVNRFDKQTFRHLDPATKERDYAQRLLKRVAEDCNQTLGAVGSSQWSFTDQDIDDLLNYCDQEGLGLMRTSLSGMLAVGDEESRRNFRRVQMYTNLKNLLTSYEYLLKSLAEKGSQNIGGKTLVPTVRAVMAKESWLALFNSSAVDSAGNSLLRAENTTDFLNNFDTLLTDISLKNSADGYWARSFLVACLARNMTVHAYPSEDRYYGVLFGPMLNAVITSSFYTWKLAQRETWI